MIDYLDQAQKISSNATLTSSGVWISLLCPFHNDTRPSAVLSQSDGYFKCQGCDTSMTYNTFVQRVKQEKGVTLEYPKYTAQRLIKVPTLIDSALNYAFNGINALKWDHGDYRISNKYLKAVGAKYYEEMIGGIHVCRIYLPVIIQRYKIGYIGRMLGIPNDVKLSYPQEQWLSKNEKGFRYNDCEGPWRRLALFPYDKIINYPVFFLVEGAFDALNLIQHGLPAMALLGSSISDERLNLIPKDKTILLMMDNDEKGWLAQEKIYSIMIKKGFKVKRVYLKCCKDPGGLDTNSITELKTWFIKHKYKTLDRKEFIYRNKILKIDYRVIDNKKGVLLIKTLRGKVVEKWLKKNPL